MRPEIEVNHERIPEAESYESKEVYAFYGLAAYCGQLLEKGLVNLMSTLRTEGVSITREQFDKIFASYDRLTLGVLLRDARKMIDIPLQTDQILAEALEKRNFLVHHYFFQRAPAFMTEAGRKNMIEELQGFSGLFQMADEAIKPIYRPLLELQGITEEALRREAEKMVAEFLESNVTSEKGNAPK